MRMKRHGEKARKRDRPLVFVDGAEGEESVLLVMLLVLCGWVGLNEGEEMLFVRWVHRGRLKSVSRNLLHIFIAQYSPSPSPSTPPLCACRTYPV